MDTNALVDSLIDAGQKLADALVLSGFEVAAACWLKRVDDKWRYYIVSPVVDAKDAIEAYRQIHPVARAMPQPYAIDPLAIKVIGPRNSMAQDVITAHARLRVPQTVPIRWPGRQLGQVVIDDAYIYPLPSPSAAP